MIGRITLKDTDLESVLEARDSWRETMPTGSAVATMLEALSRLVGCDQVFWTWIDVTRAVKLDEVGYPQPPRPIAVDQWAAHRDEHPICSGRHDPVIAISDVLDTRTFHETWLYQECFRPSGLEHEIGVNLSHRSGQISDLVLSRGPGRDFDHRDHLVLQFLRPHLDAAFRRLVLPPPALTPREKQVLNLVRDGQSNAEVARSLGVMESTVVKHLENVYARTGARSRTQALRLCAEALD